MQTTIIAVGKIRKGWMAEGVAEYSRRLSRFGKLNVIEVADEPIPQACSAKDLRRLLKKEGERMLTRWPDGAWGVALDIQGRSLGSRGLADFIEQRMAGGFRHLVFAVGGSHGLSDDVRNQCRTALSFGPHTFPHMLFRVMLLEQLYRAAKIRSGEAYHK